MSITEICAEIFLNDGIVTLCLHGKYLFHDRNTRTFFYIFGDRLQYWITKYLCILVVRSNVFR
jgi:hypothetical protein